MGIKKYKPTTPSRRYFNTADFAEITTSTPEKSLLEPLRKKGGRNHHGHVTSRFRGGGHKQAYRRIDFRRDKHGIAGKIATIEYDPNRNARIALVVYADGEKRYIIAPLGLKVEDQVMSGPDAELRTGNALPLSKIPLGTVVHAVELRPGQGARIARGAGTFAQLMAKEGPHALLRLPSGEVRKVHAAAMRKRLADNELVLLSPVGYSPTGEGGVRLAVIFIRAEPPALPPVNAHMGLRPVAPSVCGCWRQSKLFACLSAIWRARAMASGLASASM